MLTAKKSAWFEKIFAIYCRNLFKRRFHAVKVSGLKNLQPKADLFPVIIYCNHSSWWDGLIAFEISKVVKMNSFVMMEEKQLKKLSLFRKLGAFSVVRESPRQALKSINYAADLLKTQQNAALWIFPQGEILSNDFRPIKFFNGVSKIIEKTGKCYAVPLAIRYEFFGNFKPEVLVEISTPELIETDKNFNSKDLTVKFENHLVETLDNLKGKISANNFQNFEQII